MQPGGAVHENGEDSEDFLIQVSISSQYSKSIEKNIYIYTKFAGLHLVYGIAEGIGCTAAHFYQECFSYHSLVAHLHQNLCEYGSLKSGKTGEGRP